ncbi:phosphatidate phosphatase PAH2-like isoform X2 [Cornus florida]|uniref:phosphatidate phosphatase PAH2-like isoform X2 n=1 Tax=Cornus florida TaxID=4283 RepID=UPI0028A21A91|nr:phosphatidate phosphatase PAH2-like isoform X2 [Cornus florida]
MYAVGRFISRGVYTVSAPFHPFGGAVDIIVVEQQDGSFKSSPWYVKFGKFQGVLKRNEKVVNISVNEVEADFHMYLDHKGEAYFLRDSDVVEEDESTLYPSSSGEETEGQSSDRKPMKSKSCDYDATKSDPVTEIDVSNEGIVARTGSRRSRIMGLVFGRNSIKGDRLGVEGDSSDVGRIDSMERAEIAADLLEVKWSTNLASGRQRNDRTPEISVPDISNGGEIQDLQINDQQRQANSLANSNVENGSDHHVSHEEIVSHDHGTSNGSQPGFQELKSSVEGTGMGISCLITERVVGTLTPTGSGLGENDEINSAMSETVNELGVSNADHDEDGQCVTSVIAIPNSEIAEIVELEAFTSEKLDENQDLINSEMSETVNELGVRNADKDEDGKCVTSVITSPNSEIVEPEAFTSKKLNENQDLTNSEMSETVNELGVRNADHDEDGKCVTSVITIPNSEVAEIVELEAYTNKKLDENKDLMDSEMSERVDELGVRNADHDEDGQCATSVITIPNSEIAEIVELEAYTSKKLDENQDFDNNVVLPCSAVSEEENGADKLQSNVDCEASESPRAGLDGSGKQSGEMLYLPCGGSGEVHVHSETFHETTELKSLVNSSPKAGLLLAKESLDFQEILGDKNGCNVFNDANIPESEGTSTSSSSIANGIVTDTYSQMVTVSSINVSVKEVESQSFCSVSGFSNPICQVKDEKNDTDEDNNLQHSSEPVGVPQESSDHVPTEATNNLVPEGSEEEQFAFSDLDDFQIGGVQCTNLISADHEEKDNPSLTPENTEIVIESFDSNFEFSSSPDKFVQENPPNSDEDSRQKSRILSRSISIPGSSEVPNEEVGRMVESLPNLRLNVDDMDAPNLHHSLGRSLDLNYKSSKWMLLRKEYSKLVKSEADREHQFPLAQPTTTNDQILEELKDVPANPATGDTSTAIDASGGSWWSFPFKRSRSMKATQSAINRTRSSDAGSTFESAVDVDGEKDVLELKVNKKKVRAITPTSEQLASLNLKEGRNTVTFTFSTAMLGKQQVEAKMYLWRWDTRIVISDVDGTITKSDVLGQFMPMFGMDWSQTGVAHLFSAIKENGYQLLFLSARAISQAYHTRQFLFNLKQNGKALPDGPIVISPDGLFPSLFREVIRRAPHEFKIACLEDIKALFPPDRNPFYAGFGNRDTDEFSYLKVGIPKGKIFIINPKGQVVVNRCVNTKSYTSLHDLVHNMFPMSSSEQGYVWSR